MNGNPKKQVAVALASFMVGAAVVGILGNAKARETLAEILARSKTLIQSEQ